MVKPPQPPAELPTSAVTGNGSILSALRQERPAKRSRPDASELFKEVQLPHQLQQKQMQSRPRKSRRVSNSRGSSASKSSSAKSSQDTLLRVVAGAKSMHKAKTLDFAGTSKTRLASTSKLPGETDLLRRAARPSSAKAPTAHLLHRSMSERSHFAGLQATVSSSPGTAAQVGRTAATGRTQSPSTPGAAMRRAVSTSSVVMRTPDRPKRLAARTTRRVLVEASPPLRRPNGAGASAPRLLQAKSSRPGVNPPPLFR